MAERRCGNQGRLTDAAAAAATRRAEQQQHHHHHTAMNLTEEAAADCLSLEEILGLYGQPINEEQAWAVCYQCCRTLAKGHRSRRSSCAAAGASSAAAAAAPRRISGPGDVRIQRDGSVRVEHQGCEGKTLFETELAPSCANLGQAVTSFSTMELKCCDCPFRENSLKF